MGPLLAFFLFMLGFLVLAAITALGITWMENRENNRAIRKKRVLQLERTQDEIESLVIHTLTVDPQDITANQVASVLRKSRTKELKRR